MPLREHQQTEAFLHAALDAWGDAVYRLALAQTRSTADAQDVAQEVFIKLLEHEEPFQSDEHLKAWLLRVTINRCRDLHRSAWQSRVESLDASLPDTQGQSRSPSRLVVLPDQDATPEDAAIAALSRNPVWDALALLPEEQQLVMHLRYVEECDEDQIASIMGCSPVTVRTRLHRARKRLRMLLEAHQEVQGGPESSPTITSIAQTAPIERNDHEA